MSEVAIAPRRYTAGRVIKKALKAIPLIVLGFVFIPFAMTFYICCGISDVLRNRNCDLVMMERYFIGNGFFTWMLSPFNLLMDLLCYPYSNRGIYALTDLPEAYQREIQTLIDSVHQRNLVGELESKLGETGRGMIFFKWYGRNLESSLDVPEFHQPFKYIRTIGVSVFNKRQSTRRHFGPLRITLRLLYNINETDNRKVFIEVGDHTHYWQDEKLFIFDDTLQHRSCNESSAVRYCLFVDILRPSCCAWLLSSILHAVRVCIAPFNFIFYGSWTFMK